MNTEFIETVNVAPIYIALLGLMFVPMTMIIGFYRFKNKIDIGDNGDKKLFRMIRSQANFVETVPIAAILLLTMDLLGASDALIHAMGATLVISRLLHYVGLSRLGPFIARPLGMIGTFTVYVVCSIAVFYVLI